MNLAPRIGQELKNLRANELDQKLDKTGIAADSALLEGNNSEYFRRYSETVVDSIPTVSSEALASSSDVPGLVRGAQLAGLGGGGGAIALEQDRIEVTAAATKLNFTEGLFVDATGTVSTSPPVADNWSVDLGPAEGGFLSIASYVSNTNVYTGTSSDDFSSVTCGGYATAIPTGTYFEMTVPSGANHFTSVLLNAAALDGEVLSATLGAQYPSTDYVGVLIQRANLGTYPSTGAGQGLNQVMSADSLTFGLELASTGVWVHISGVRTKIRDALTGIYTLSAIGVDQTDAPATTTIIDDPILPESVEAGVTTLAAATGKVHPSKAYSDEYTPPPKATDEEMATGTITNPRTMNPRGIVVAMDAKYPALSLADLYDASKTGSYSVDIEVMRQFMWGLSGYEVNYHYEDGGTDKSNVSTNMFTITKEGIGHYRFRFKTTNTKWKGNISADSYTVSAVSSYGSTAHVSVFTSAYFDIYVTDNYTNIKIDASYINLTLKRILNHSSFLIA